MVSERHLLTPRSYRRTSVAQFGIAARCLEDFEGTSETGRPAPGTSHSISGPVGEARAAPGVSRRSCSPGAPLAFLQTGPTTSAIGCAQRRNDGGARRGPTPASSAIVSVECRHSRCGEASRSRHRVAPPCSFLVVRSARLCPPFPCPRLLAATLSYVLPVRRFRQRSGACPRTITGGTRQDPSTYARPRGALEWRSAAGGAAVSAASAKSPRFRHNSVTLNDALPRFAEHLNLALDALVLAGDLPAGLERRAVTVEPPRDASHGDARHQCGNGASPSPPAPIRVRWPRRSAPSWRSRRSRPPSRSPARGHQPDADRRDVARRADEAITSMAATIVARSRVGDGTTVNSTCN